jgi:subtilisin family serine protease
MRRLCALAVTAATLAVAPAAGAAAPSDPYWALQWGPRQVHAEQAWATSTGAGQTIAVVDTGIDLTHPDLAGKIELAISSTSQSEPLRSWYPSHTLRKFLHKVKL